VQQFKVILVDGRSTYVYGRLRFQCGSAYKPTPMTRSQAEEVVAKHKLDKINGHYWGEPSVVALDDNVEK
jgi:hypothetical protein